MLVIHARGVPIRILVALLCKALGLSLDATLLEAYERRRSRS